jgi:uncharacterized OB-fold protein
MSGPGSAHESRSELSRRRDRLAEEVSELHWNLGGLTYEMAIRDHFRLDVLVRRAAMLQERDAELAEVERLLHMQESSVAGNCSSCGAVHSRGAVFCWQCGAKVMEQATDASGKIDSASVDFHALTANGRGDRVRTRSSQVPAIALRETAQGEVSSHTAAKHETDSLDAGPPEAGTLGRPIQASQ